MNIEKRKVQMDRCEKTTEEKEGEIKKKIKAILTEQERGKALTLLAEEISQSIPEEELEKFLEKLREYRELKPAD